MSIKSFLLKKALQLKGVSSDQADKISKELSENPQLAASLKALESNKEIKDLFEKIQKEIAEKKKGGLGDEYAAVLVMGKYKADIMKHREALAPLLALMQK
ncbi:MAG: hypothetical protein V4665_04245 [Patescibacteria group bacterium]